MLGYLRLVRLPNVFTALADIVAGFAIMRALQGGDGIEKLFFVLGASGALYLSGMAFNDIADRDEDAVVRPTRPIPSKQVSLWGAVLCAVLLMASGIALAAWCGINALLRAALLATAILKYNFSSKSNVLMGPLMLGLCRFLNVQLGMAASPHFASALQSASIWEAPWAAPAAVGIYAAGLTAFSAQEEAGHRRRAIILGWIFCGSAILIATLTGERRAWIALFPLAVILLLLTRRLQRLKTPHAARDLVRAGVMGICVLDAGLVLAFARLDAAPFALICAALLVPAIIVAKLLAQKEA